MQLRPIEIAPHPVASAPSAPSAAASSPFLARIQGALLQEVLTMLALLRDYASVTVLGPLPETYLFERGFFVGAPEALARLRGRLAAGGEVEVILASNSTLAGLFGGPVAVTALILDPEDKLAA